MGETESTKSDAVLTHAAASLTVAAKALERLSSARERSQRAPTPKRGLSRSEAANYVGVSPTTFDRMVGEKTMPKPLKAFSRNIWDINALDVAFEAIANGDDDNNPWDNWR